MIKFAATLCLSVAALGLAACGSSDGAKEQAQPDNVEMPAEEIVGDLAAEATPAVDASAQADAAAAATDEAASMATGASAPTSSVPGQ